MRLIDADALLNRMQKDPLFDLVERYGVSGVIEAEPTVDAVPVIRCKDCRWFDTKDISGTVEPIGYRCKLVARLWREPDDFCKRAERKEDDIN